MSRDKIKNDISDLQLNIKARVKEKEMGIFEKIDLYTKIYESQEYKTLRKAVESDPKCDPTLYLDDIPYTKRELFNHLLDMELNYFPKIIGFVDSGNE
jgi:hypothetical protein